MKSIFRNNFAREIAAASFFNCASFSHGQNKIQINVKENTDVLYDYFFKHDNQELYKLKFKHHGNKAVADELAEYLENVDKSILIEKIEKDTDHGVWVPCKLMFREETLPLRFPIISLSTLNPKYNNFSQQINLGISLSKLREMGYIIVSLGMIVHNVYASLNSNAVIDQFKNDNYELGTITNDNFEKDFTKEAQDLVSLDNMAERRKLTAELEFNTRSNLRFAHPSFEHFTPFLIFIGTSLNDDIGFTYDINTYDKGMSYASFKFQ